MEIKHGNRRVYVSAAMLLSIIVIVMLQSMVHVYAQTPYSGIELRRHAPILGNITLDQNYIEELLRVLESNVTDPELENILEEINQSIASGDVESYNQSVGMLKNYLENINSSEAVNLDPNIIRQLALIASSSPGEGQFQVDLEDYLRLVNSLYSKTGREPVSLNDLEPSLKGLGNLSTASSGSFNAPLPNVTIPSLGEGGGTGLTISSTTLIEPLIYTVALLGAAYLAYSRRSTLRNLFYRSIGRAWYRLYEEKIDTSDLRAAVIRCFNTLVKTLRRIGIEKYGWETAREFAGRLADSKLREIVWRAVKAYEKARYSGKPLSTGDLEECNKSVEEVLKG